MEQQLLKEAIDRIQRMEQHLDVLQRVADENPAMIHADAWLRACLERLMHYYEGGQWLHDYELDEQRLLPPDLKSGVLSDDAVYDLLTRLGGVI